MIRVALFLAVTGAVSFGMTGCLHLFMGGAVPHNESRAPHPAAPKDGGP